MMHYAFYFIFRWFLGKVLYFINLFIYLSIYFDIEFIRKPWKLLLTIKNLMVQHFSWLHDRVNHVALHIVETETLPTIYFNETEVLKRSHSGSVCRSSFFFFLFLQEQILPIYFFFLEGMVTNPAIWLVLYPVSIFLSLPTGHSNAFLSRRVHPYFHCHFS